MPPATLRVLVADDNVVNRQLATAQFESLGYQIDLASDGAEALEVMAHSCFDVVFMDVQMPRLDGLDATRAICARLDKPIRPWIVGMTADDSDDQRRRCLAAGMDDCVAKPVSRLLLAQILANRQLMRHATRFDG